jgi:hypothetical protein
LAEIVHGIGVWAGEVVQRRKHFPYYCPSASPRWERNPVRTPILGHSPRTIVEEDSLTTKPQFFSRGGSGDSRGAGRCPRELVSLVAPAEAVRDCQPCRVASSSSPRGLAAEQRRTALVDQVVMMGFSQQRVMRFRPCIDLHDGVVKQVVHVAAEALPSVRVLVLGYEVPDTRPQDRALRNCIPAGGRVQSLS